MTALMLEATALPWPRALRVGSVTGSGLVIATPVLLTGWAVRETSGTAVAALDLHSGHDDTGQLIASLGMVAGGPAAAGPNMPGVICPGGLYAAVRSGAMDGAVWVVMIPAGDS